MKVAGLLLVLSAAVYGQVNTATVSGSVTDPWTIAAARSML
jgi:hypothetical protein